MSVQINYIVLLVLCLFSMNGCVYVYVYVFVRVFRFPDFDRIHHYYQHSVMIYFERPSEMRNFVN